MNLIPTLGDAPREASKNVDHPPTPPRVGGWGGIPTKRIKFTFGAKKGKMIKVDSMEMKEYL